MILLLGEQGLLERCLSTEKLFSLIRHFMKLLQVAFLLQHVLLRLHGDESVTELATSWEAVHQCFSRV